MGEFVRGQSKVWWGKFHGTDDVAADEEEEEDWRVGAVPSIGGNLSGNNSCAESDRGSSGSPESHKSQDSGFSDSETGHHSPTSSAGTSLKRKSEKSQTLEASSSEERKFRSEQIDMLEGKMKKSPGEDTLENSEVKANKERHNESSKSFKIYKSPSAASAGSTPTSYPLKDIKNTLERNPNLNRRALSSSRSKDIENHFRVERTPSDDKPNLSYHNDVHENRKKFNLVVKELKSSIVDGTADQYLIGTSKSKPRQEFPSTLPRVDTTNSSYKCVDKLKVVDTARTKELSHKPTKTECVDESCSQDGEFNKNDKLVNSNVINRCLAVRRCEDNLSDSSSSKTLVTANGTVPKTRINASESSKSSKVTTRYRRTYYNDFNKSLERTRLRRSEINECTVEKLFSMQNDTNKNLELNRSRTRSETGESSPDDSEHNSSSDSSFYAPEETARFVGNVVSNSGADSSTWSIPGPPAHCSTPKSSPPPQAAQRVESVKRITPQKLHFNDDTVACKQSFDDDNNLECQYELDNRNTDRPLNHWLNEIRYLYEPECMTTLQSKSLTADLNSQVTIMAAVTTEAVRVLQFRTKLISTEFSKLYRQVESGVMDHVGPLAQSLLGHISEFLNKCSSSKNDKQLLVKTCDRLRSVAFSANLERDVLVKETTSLGRAFTRCVDNLLLEQVQMLISVLDEPTSPIITLTALSSLTGLGLVGKHLSQLVARCSGGIRAILTICFESRNVAIRTAALRTLTTVCCSSHTIRQLEQAGGVEILSEILQDDSRSEMELSEAVSVIVQITAPWIEDNQAVMGLSQQLKPLVSAITRLISNTTSSSVLLLCAAALCHLSQLEPQCVWTMLENSTAGTLLLAIRRQGPFAPVFLREQAAGLLANMAAVPEARSHLAEHRAVVALLCFLHVQHSPLQSNAEIAASERLQHKSAIALSRICTDPAVAAQVVELQGVTRLVRLCREERERNHSDGVLVACLAALRKIVANCGTKSVEDLNALELVEPRLLDSFLIYSSRQESYV